MGLGWDQGVNDAMGGVTVLVFCLASEKVAEFYHL